MDVKKTRKKINCWLVRCSGPFSILFCVYLCAKTKQKERGKEATKKANAKIATEKKN